MHRPRRWRQPGESRRARLTAGGAASPAPAGRKPAWTRARQSRSGGACCRRSWPLASGGKSLDIFRSGRDFSRDAVSASMSILASLQPAFCGSTTTTHSLLFVSTLKSRHALPVERHGLGRRQIFYGARHLDEKRFKTLRRAALLHGLGDLLHQGRKPGKIWRGGNGLNRGFSRLTRSTRAAISAASR